MKEKIHPKFYTDCKVTCEQRNVAARGRIEKFNKRYNVESK